MMAEKKALIWLLLGVALAALPIVIALVAMLSELYLGIGAQ